MEQRFKEKQKVNKMETIIKKGDWFRCIRSTLGDRKSFVRGRYYKSEFDGRITCENGNMNYNIGGQFYKDHFVKLYSIKDLSDGKVAVRNDGTVDELYSVMKAANGYTINKNYVPCRYYYRGSENESSTKWHGGHVTELPIQSIKDFIVQIPKSKVSSGDGYQLGPENGTDIIFEVGDAVYDIREGWGNVKTVIYNYTNYPVEVEFETGVEKYTQDGRFYLDDKHRSLSFTEYNLVTGGFSQERPKPVTENCCRDNVFPKVMWVYNKNQDLKVKRVVFAYKNGEYLAWSNAETIEAAEKTVGVASWNHAEEVVEPLKLTLKQIADKFGVEEIEIVGN